MVQDLFNLGLVLTEGQVEGIDEVRKVYKKYKADLDYLTVYPRHGIKNAQILANDILRLSEECSIECEFKKLDRAELWDVPDDEIVAYKVPHEFRDKESYVTFIKNGIDITKLIAF